MNSIINDLKQQLQDKDDYYNKQLKNQKNENNSIKSSKYLMESLISKKEKNGNSNKWITRKIEWENFLWKIITINERKYELETKINKEA